MLVDVGYDVGVLRGATDRDGAGEHVGVRHGQLDAGDLRHPGLHAGGDDHLVEVGQRGDVGLGAEPDLDAEHLHEQPFRLAALRAGDEPGLRLAVRTDVTQGLRMLKG